MRPERLEFCGINSFSEKAVIDFGKLLAGGIFGIYLLPRMPQKLFENIIQVLILISAVKLFF